MTLTWGKVGKGVIVKKQETKSNFKIIAIIVKKY